MGTKTVLNEFVSSGDLAQTPSATLDAPSRVIVTYALCGFANFGSIGILVGGLGGMLPDRRAELATLGLRALLAVLAPGGGLGLMVYAPHGRTGVYMLQDALRRLAPDDALPAARLDVARRVMRSLPDSAWLRRNTLFADHITGGDAGLYDLLLNPRDQAYDVPAFAALLAGAGLQPTCWMEPMRYDPAIYLTDAKLRQRLAGLSPVARAAVAEAVCGNISTHVVYAVRAADAPAAPDGANPAAIPVMREMPGDELAKHIRPDGTLPFLFDGLRIPVPLPPLAAPILRLVDGVRTVAAIREAMAGRASPEAFDRAWRATYDPLSALNRLLLAAPE